MTPYEFATKWGRAKLSESAGSQEHFIDICRLVGQATPAEANPNGDFFTFELRRRTLTNLYNDPPTWLRLAHQRLDAAVSAAYGWSANLTDGEIIARLLDLNLEQEAVG